MKSSKIVPSGEQRFFPLETSIPTIDTRTFLVCEFESGENLIKQFIVITVWPKTWENIYIFVVDIRHRNNHSYISLDTNCIIVFIEIVVCSFFYLWWCPFIILTLNKTLLTTRLWTSANTPCSK